MNRFDERSGRPAEGVGLAHAGDARTDRNVAAAADGAEDRAPRAVLAEDEPELAAELAEHLATLWPQLRIVARAGDGTAALQAIDEHAPDLAFLDIRLPRLSGLEVARHVGARCHVAFITAFDSYAIDAFEAGAIDYVLKPVTPARLLTTVRRLKARLAGPPTDLTHLLEQVRDRADAAPRFCNGSTRRAVPRCA